MSSTGDPMDTYLGRTWGLVLCFALTSIALGAIMLAWPKETIKVLAVLTGLYLILSGVFQLVASFAASGAGTGRRVFIGISGMVSILLGVFAFRDVGQAVAVLALLVGFSWLFRGIAEVVEAVADKGTLGRGWAIVVGLVAAAAGIVVLVWPISSLTVLAWITGLSFVLLGAVELAEALALRKVQSAA